MALPSTSSTQNGIAGALNYTFAISPTHLLQFRYGVTRLVIAVQSASDGFDPTKLGFPGYIRDSANLLTFPAFAPSGYLAIGGGASGSVGKLGVTTHTWELSDNKVFSRHNLKYGVETRLDVTNANQVGKSTGSYTFDPTYTQGPNALSASNVAGDGFASFLVGLGSGSLTHNFKIIDTLSHYWAGYIQDDWKATSNLTFIIGLRYDLFLPRTERHDRANFLDLTSPSPLAGPSGIPGLVGGLGFVGVNGAPRTQTDTNYKNFAPRFGFAYHPAKRLVMRGGYGIFFTTQATEAAATIGSTGFRTDTPLLGSVDGVTPNNYLSNPFPGGSFLPISGSSLGLLTNAGGGIAAPLRHSPSTYSQNWNFGLQYQLPSNWLVDVSYVGSRGVQLIWNPSYNQLPVSDLAMGSALLQNVKNPFYGSITTAGPLAGPTVQQRYRLPPYPQFTGVGWSYQPGASSDYNSLQVRVEKRFGNGLSLLASYTKSKLMDDASSNNQSNFNGSGTSQDAYNRHSDWSLSTADVQDRLVLSGVYTLPFGRKQRFGANWNRWIDVIAGGWQANGISTFQGGFPLALSASNTANIFNPGERPNNNGTSALLGGSIESRLNGYFNTSVFSQPAPFTLGNTSRTLPDVRTPGLFDIDLSLFKDFTLRESMTLQFRAESFNVTNRPGFGAPNTTVPSSSLGVISTQINPPRQNQLALKLIF
ncbi:MAG TPA: TonB-dependent receptor [Bryobacteraceae bacterium]|nr:TonB-dependent receptor [Bryobacteraceae bacterium]